MSYLSNPAAIYEQSFATIRAEADLDRIPDDLRGAVTRMIHACGMTDLVGDVVWSGAVAAAVRTALQEHASILCDCEMVRAGISRTGLQSEVVVTLNDPRVPELADRLGTTRSAVAVELWRERLEGAVVVIGNAPTALFRLLELLEEGAPGPAAIIATPVGFVGAAESKAQLAGGAYAVPFITVLGRRGGSAMASAAFNALAGAGP